MLFHSFNNQDERRASGGSDFLELQFCHLKRGTSIKNIEPVKLAVDGIHPTNLGHKVIADAIEKVIEFR